MDSCRKASKASTTERLWTYSRNPQRRDIRKSNTNPWTVHRFTEESLWTDASYNPSWVHDMSRLEKTENRCALKAQGANHHNNKNSGGWEMLSLEEALSSLREGMSPLQPSVEVFACILHMCRKERNKAHALHLHAYICKSGLEVHPSLGNHLFLMLVEVGCMSHAQEVFDRLVCRDECSWNSLIIGYVKCGELQLALTLYHKMQEEVSLHPSGQAFVALLKACTALKDLERGHEIHADIARKGLLESNVFVGSTLVDMYAKCGSLAKAQEVFDNLSVRNVVSWNVLITGYAEHGHGHEALAYFEQMQQRKDLSPDAVTYVCSLKACGTIGATLKGREIHAEIERKGLLEGDIFLGSTLVDMYAKCGTLTEAQAVFDKIPDQNVVSWNALIAGYVEHGHGKEALNCFEQMQLEGISPSAVTFVCSLKACCSIQAIGKGQEIHAEIAKKGLLERDVVLGSTLVDMYAKSGSLAKAQDVFDKLLVRNVVSWNALMAGYVEHGHCEEALTCFEQMQQEGISPDAVTLICSLKACSSMGTTVKGREIHTEIVRKGLEGDLFLGSTLVDMYAKCGSLAKAQEVFDKLRAQNVVSWTALIAGYAEHGCGEEALWCFEQMQQEGVSPGAVTFVCSLKACGSIVATVKGQEIHAEIAKKGMERDDAVGSTLVDMYVKCGLLVEAHVVFENLPFQEVFSWTALMTGFVECRRGEEALNCFEQMKHMGIFPDAVTFVCSLKACGSIGATVKGREIHAEIAKKGLEKELLVGNTLVDMYAKCGLLATAQEVFDKLPIRDVVSWNALITRYVEFGHGGEALNCFEQMQHEGISPDAVALVCSLIACGSIGAIVKGQEIHAEITRRGLERELLVGNTLVDLYAKCGSFATAQYVFDKLRVRSMVSWNALMVGYAQLGESENVFQIFHGMTGEGTEPDLVTFLSILSACNHAGLVDKGQMYFEAIINDYDLIPTLEHYNCMVDLLGRAGHIDKAVAMIKNMPFHPGIVVWQTVLGACRKWGDVELGRHAFEHVVCFDEKDAAAYVCMYNIYVDAVMHEEANKVEALRVEKQAWKKQAQNLWMDTCPRDCGFLFGWG